MLDRIINHHRKVYFLKFIVLMLSNVFCSFFIFFDGFLLSKCGFVRNFWGGWMGWELFQLFKASLEHFSESQNFQN